LVESVFPDQGRGNLRLDVLNGLQASLAAVPRRVAVPEFDRFPFARRGSGGNDGRADRAVVLCDASLHGRIAARVENFLGGNVLDEHGHFLFVERIRFGNVEVEIRLVSA